jgi:hypothetical protein
VKALGVGIGLIVVAGALAALGVALMPLEPAVRASAYFGAGLGTALGLVALSFKTWLVRNAPPGKGGIKALMTGQVVTFLMRVLAIGAGAIAVHADPAASPVAFVVTFFLVYLAQQFVEVRSLLAAGAAKPQGDLT